MALDHDPVLCRIALDLDPALCSIALDQLIKLERHAVRLKEIIYQKFVNK
jgi:hypothetical protein